MKTYLVGFMVTFLVLKTHPEGYIVTFPVQKTYPEGCRSVFLLGYMFLAEPVCPKKELEI